MGVENIPRTLEFGRREDAKGVVRFGMSVIDQRLLPDECRIVSLFTYGAAVDAIQTLMVRGAPAIGVAGAGAVALWASNQAQCDNPEEYAMELRRVADEVAHARPTAVNLAWGVKQVVSAIGDVLPKGRVACAEAARKCVCELAAQDEAVNRAIGQNGARLLHEGSRVLTHCNAGSLATVFYGTALGVIYAAHEQKRIVHVYCDETRPVGQGIRLTAWELGQAGIPCTVQCDGMAAMLMKQGLVDAVIVGADRICANGDTANKVGTYQLAIAADYHRVPFYVAAPTSTIDVTLSAGSQIPIEFRDASEVAAFRTFEPHVYNPAFDVTPASLINGFITEKGVIRPVLHEDGSLFDLRDLSRIAPL
jgi:methylthioribose-1-phosphate isomerase